MDKDKMLIKLLVCFLIISLGGNVLFSMYLYQHKNMATAAVSTHEVITEELNEYAQNVMADKLTCLFSEDELMRVAQSHYQYMLTVNNQKVKNSSVTLENVSNVRIMLTESVSDSESLPEQIQKKGSLIYGDETNELTDYLGIHTTQRYEISKIEDHANTKYYIDFKDVPKNTVISVSVGQVLCDNLSNAQGITDNHFDIIVQ